MFYLTNRTISKGFSVSKEFTDFILVISFVLSNLVCLRKIHLTYQYKSNTCIIFTFIKNFKTHLFFYSFQSETFCQQRWFLVLISVINVRLSKY